MADVVNHINIDAASKHGPDAAIVVRDTITAINELVRVWGKADALRNDASPADDAKLEGNGSFGITVGEGDDFFTVLNSIKGALTAADLTGWLRRLDQG